MVGVQLRAIHSSSSVSSQCIIRSAGASSNPGRTTSFWRPRTVSAFGFLLPGPGSYRTLGFTSFLVTLLFLFLQLIFASKILVLAGRCGAPRLVRPAVTLLTLSVRIMFRHRFSWDAPFPHLVSVCQVSDPFFGYVSGDASGVEVLPALGSVGAGGRSDQLFGKHVLSRTVAKGGRYRVHRRILTDRSLPSQVNAYQNFRGMVIIGRFHVETIPPASFYVETHS